MMTSRPNAAARWVACLALAALLGPPPARAAYDARILKAQRELRDLGYYWDDPNGYPSPETTEALRRYQEDNGLERSGALDDDTLSKLGISLASFGELQKKAILISPLSPLLTERIYMPLANVKDLPPERFMQMDEFQRKEAFEALGRQREAVQRTLYQINIPYDERSTTPNFFTVSDYDFRQKRFAVRVHRGYAYDPDYAIDFGREKTFYIQYDDAEQAKSFKHANEASALQAEVIFRPLRTERIQTLSKKGRVDRRWGYMIKCDMLALRIVNRRTGEVLIQDENPTRYDAISREARDIFKEDDAIVW